MISVGRGQRLRPSDARDARRARARPGARRLPHRPRTGASSSSPTGGGSTVADGAVSRLAPWPMRPTEARLPPHRQRPPEDRDGARAAPRATSSRRRSSIVSALGHVRRGRGRALQRRQPLRRRAARRRRGRRRPPRRRRAARKGGWKAADVEGGRGLPRDARARHRARLVAEELKKDSPLGKACAKAGEVLAYDVAKKKLARLGRRAVPAARRAAPSPRRARRSSSSSATTSHALAIEVDKLATWAGGRADRRARGRALVAADADDADRSRSPMPGRPRRRRARSPRARRSSSASRSRAATPRRGSPARSASHLGRLRALQAARRRGRPADARRRTG